MQYAYTVSEIDRNREIEEIFKMFDSNSSGTIEIDELREVVSLLKCAQPFILYI